LRLAERAIRLAKTLRHQLFHIQSGSIPLCSTSHEYRLIDTVPCLLIRNCRSCTPGTWLFHATGYPHRVRYLCLTITMDIPCLSLIAQFRRFDGHLSHLVDRDGCCRFGRILRGTKEIVSPQGNSDSYRTVKPYTIEISKK
jgi:hypothetical protein